jgi:hypothetical protein
MKAGGMQKHLQGRKSVKDLQGRLRRQYAQYSALPKRTATVKRMAMVQMLGDVALHLMAQPDANGADTFLLLKLNKALYDTERGVHIDYFTNRKRGPIPDTTNIKIMRGRIAADVELLIRAGWHDRDQAAISVCQKLPKSSPVFRGRAKRNPETVRRWHYNIPTMSETSVERQEYEARLLAKSRK